MEEGERHPIGDAPGHAGGDGDVANQTPQGLPTAAHDRTIDMGDGVPEPVDAAQAARDQGFGLCWIGGHKTRLVGRCKADATVDPAANPGVISFDQMGELAAYDAVRRLAQHPDHIVGPPKDQGLGGHPGIASEPQPHQVSNAPACAQARQDHARADLDPFQAPAQNADRLRCARRYGPQLLPTPASVRQDL